MLRSVLSLSVLAVAVLADPVGGAGKEKPKPKEYVIEPPDVLVLECTCGTVKVRRDALVRPDGTVSLGDHGSVYVAEMTAKQAKEAIEKVLREKDKKAKATVAVKAFDSKFFYVITEGRDGARVMKLPATGNETVLDAIEKACGVAFTTRKAKVWVARLQEGKTEPKILPVDWKGLTESGETATNYELRVGDRVYVHSDGDTPRLRSSPVSKTLNPVGRVLGKLVEPDSKQSLAVANVTKETVKLFRVTETGLEFLQEIAAGEAFDVDVKVGDKFAATFASEPHCANFVAGGKKGETWLLRPAAKATARAEPKPLPPYAVEPPDILVLDGPSFKDEPAIKGEHLVRPDGTISLGSYGSVPITGLTLPEAKAAVEKHLSKYVVDPEISVDVLAYNSKVYHVITDDPKFGQQVYELPHTGNETVLDGISSIHGLPAIAAKKKVWVSRPVKDKEPQLLPVDWKAITESGATATNYQLLPGDRVYVTEPPWPAPRGLAKIDSPTEKLIAWLRSWVP